MLSESLFQGCFLRMIFKPFYPVSTKKSFCLQITIYICYSGREYRASVGQIFISLDCPYYLCLYFFLFHSAECSSSSRSEFRTHWATGKVVYQTMLLHSFLYSHFQKTFTENLFCTKLWTGSLEIKQ